MQIIKKKQINIILIVLLMLSVLMMIATKGMLFHTMAGPDSPRVPHYYNYINSHNYFAGGMYLAPFSVIFATISVIFSTVTLLQKNKGKATFFMVLGTFLMVLIVVVNITLL